MHTEPGSYIDTPTVQRRSKTPSRRHMKHAVTKQASSRRGHSTKALVQATRNTASCLPALW
jgi:hypothetical protein